MNGFITRTLAVAFLAGAMAASGCGRFAYRDYADVCYPDRYNATARREVVDAFAPQVQNGHILDQTVWNYDFDKGTDRLNGMGLAKLQYLTRRRPQPDPNIFLATASDVTYDPEHPEAMAETRRDLDTKRIASIQRYLQSQMAGRAINFEVMIHDPFEVGISAEAAAQIIRKNQVGAQGVLGFGAYGTGVGSGGNQTGQLYYVPVQSGGMSSGGTATGYGTSTAVPR
jgi:hypothetical protein